MHPDSNLELEVKLYYKILCTLQLCDILFNVLHKIRGAVLKTSNFKVFFQINKRHEYNEKNYNLMYTEISTPRHATDTFGSHKNSVPGDTVLAFCICKKHKFMNRFCLMISFSCAYYLFEMVARL